MRDLGARVAFVLAAVLAVGCSSGPAPGRPPRQVPPTEVAKAKATFAEARAVMARHDREGWSPEACRTTAARFSEVATRLGRSDRRARRAALYDQGLALSRCRFHAEAATVFEALYAEAPDHGGAKTQVALRRFEARGTAYLDEAIALVEEVVARTRFGDADALTTLAILEVARGERAGGAEDFERARKNLRRALAIDDRHMPAYNQLALLHLNEARHQVGRRAERYLAIAGATVERPDESSLDQAALICAQAIKKNPRYAPIHNTAGLVEVELGRLGPAAQAFDRARRLDPRFFEGHMNYAAVNLRFRGFAEAEAAYRTALSLEPKSYDVHLGLALALRGRIGETPDGMKLLAEAEGLIHRAKKLAPKRPEAYFNEAVLVEEFHAKGPPAKARVMLKRAKELYAAFTERARSTPGMDQALARAADRVSDIDEMLAFLE